MGLYSQYTALTESAIGGEVQIDESYAGSVGAFRIMEECSMNEHAIFESIIERDFAEAAFNNGVLEESTLEAMNEAAGSGIWAKITELFIKLRDKVLSLLKTIRTKFDALFIRDGKELVKKYEKIVNKKMNAGDLAKMKYSMPAKGEGASKLFDEFEKDLVLAKVDKTSVGRALIDTFQDAVNAKAMVTVKGVGGNTLDKARERFKAYTEEEKSDFKDNFFTAILGSSTTAKDFAKDYDEELFGDMEEKEGLTSSDYETIKKIITEYQKFSAGLSKQENLVKKFYNEYIKKADKISAEMGKLMTTSDGSYTYNAVKANGCASRASTCGNIITTCVSSYYAAIAAASKKSYSIARAIFVKAATFNAKKSVDEQTELLTAVEEASNFEVNELVGFEL